MVRFHSGPTVAFLLSSAEPILSAAVARAIPILPRIPYLCGGAGTGAASGLSFCQSVRLGKGCGMLNISCCPASMGTAAGDVGAASAGGVPLVENRDDGNGVSAGGPIVGFELTFILGMGVLSTW